MVENYKLLIFRKIFLSEIDGDDINPDDLQNKLDTVQFLLRSSNSERDDFKVKLKEVQENNVKIREEIKKIEEGGVKEKRKEEAENKGSRRRRIKEEGVGV